MESGLQGFVGIGRDGLGWVGGFWRMHLDIGLVWWPLGLG